MTPELILALVLGAAVVVVAVALAARRRSGQRRRTHTLERLRAVQYFGDHTGGAEPGVQEEDRTRPWGSDPE